MEYTRGEWEVGRKGYRETPTIIVSDLVPIEIALLGQDDRIDDDEDLANAQLIASAPRMHKAIIGALEKSHNPVVERILMEAIKDVA